MMYGVAGGRVVMMYKMSVEGGWMVMVMMIYDGRDYYVVFQYWLW